ncbi:MAG: DUF5611 family protein [Candidatus Thermoplasmatota archaeon]|jgi:hypothetical protein|nr:DUF5611 family protein [Candidatus Thermoplasmatota archaeon]MCL5786492.1 DUF5611 family protein [Candidatus Thermoplasmatota archaeon]
MREYPVKKGISLSNESIVKNCMDILGTGKIDKNKVIASCDGLKSISIEIKSPKVVAIETESIPSKNPAETIRLFNSLLDTVTGYSSKERKKLLSKI